MYFGDRDMPKMTTLSKIMVVKLTNSQNLP